VGKKKRIKQTIHTGGGESLEQGEELEHRSIGYEVGSPVITLWGERGV